MAVTCSAEFENTPAGKASLGRVVVDLLDAGRQFTCTPAFDVGPNGPYVTTGFVLTWPGAPIVDVEPVPA